MFTLGSDTYTWPVTVYSPSDGEWTKGEFVATFRLVSMDEIEAALSSEDESTLRDLVCGALVGWDGIADADGRPLPFSDAAKARLVQIPHVVRALIAAFTESIGPRQDAQGN